MDTERIRQLLDQRDRIDDEIRAAVGGEVKERKPSTCSKCGAEGHTARSCSKTT